MNHQVEVRHRTFIKSFGRNQLPTLSFHLVSSRTINLTGHVTFLDGVLLSTFRNFLCLRSCDCHLLVHRHIGFVFLNCLCNLFPFLFLCGCESLLSQFFKRLHLVYLTTNIVSLTVLPFGTPRTAFLSISKLILATVCFANLPFFNQCALKSP